MGRRVVFVIAILTLAAGPAFADKTYKVEFTEVPYRPVHAFLHVHGEIGPQPVSGPALGDQDASHVGVGLGMMSARRTNIQLVTDLAWRRVDLSDIGIAELDSKSAFEILLGGRMYPLKPTFALGTIAVRVMATGLGGMVLTEGNTDLSVVLAVGLGFSFEDDPSGLTVEFVYRPIKTRAEYFPDPATADVETMDIEPSMGLRVSFLFGP